MIISVPMLLVGIVVISMLGSLFGYLLEPGRFEEREAGAARADGAQTQSAEHSPRLAA